MEDAKTTLNYTFVYFREK